MAHPSLGAHVRRLDISFRDIPSPRARNYKQATTISQDLRIQAMEAASSHVLCENVRERLAEGQFGATLFLLLCYFPNLDSLDLNPEFGGAFFHHIATSNVLPCGLRSLRSVYIHENDVKEGTEHKEVFTLFCLPSLRVFKWGIFESLYLLYSGHAALLGQMLLFGGMSRIEDITIQSQHVETWVLAAFVRSVQRLRSFHYKEVTSAYEPFLGALLGGALQAHAQTLEDLEIRVTWLDDGPHAHTPIASLRRYTKLTRLSISMPVLIGNPDLQHGRRIGELLPESLIGFDVYVDHHWKHLVCEHLTQFIEVDLKHVPNLKQLSLRGRTGDLDTTMLQEACVASEITLSFSHPWYYYSLSLRRTFLLRHDHSSNLSVTTRTPASCPLLSFTQVATRTLTTTTACIRSLTTPQTGAPRLVPHMVSSSFGSAPDDAIAAIEENFTAASTWASRIASCFETRKSIQDCPATALAMFLKFVSSKTI